MSLFHDFFAYEFAVPGGILGQTELDCPYCDESLVLPVNEPFGEESYQCRECSGAFEVDWGEGQGRSGTAASDRSAVLSSG